MREARAPRLHQDLSHVMTIEMPFVVTVAMASVVVFLAPIGHHGNLLVYGPERYQFADFVKVGTPLTAICAVIVLLLAPLIWQG